MKKTHIATMFEQFLMVLFVILIALLVLHQANPLTSKLGRDSGIFVYVSSYLLKGETLYIPAWENKPPGVFFIDALGLWLGKGTRWGIFGMEFIFLFASVLASLYFLKQRFGIGIAVLSTALWVSGLNLILSGGNFTEEYSLAFGFAALLLLPQLVNSTTASNILLGIFLGCSFLMRQNNVGVQASIIITIVLLHFLGQLSVNLKSTLAAAGTGFLLPIAIVLYYFISRDSLQIFLDASFIYNLSYSTGNFQPLQTLYSGIRNLSFTGGITLVGICISFENLWTQIKLRKVDPLLLWLGIDFFLEIFLSSLSGRDYEHYFINWLPMAAVASAFLIEKLMVSSKQWAQNSPVVFLLTVITLIFVSFQDVFHSYRNTFSQLGTENAQVQRIDPIAEYVNTNTEPEETVLIWGGQYGINFLANRDSPSPYLLYPYYIPSRYTDQISLEYYKAVTSHPPALIIDGSYFAPSEIVSLSIANPQKWVQENNLYETPCLEDFFEFFRDNYIYEATVTEVSIYRLKR